VKNENGNSAKEDLEISVLMMPDYRRDNPYQELLSRAIEAHGCRVSFPNGYRRVLPLARAVHDEAGTQVLHLHWTGPYVKGTTRPVFLGYMAKFLADLAAVRMAGCRIVWTLHNLVPHEARFPRLEIAARKAICRVASRVIVHGEAGREEAQRRFACPAERISAIPHGHYRNVYGGSLAPSVARERLGLETFPRVALFFGFLRPYKGLELLFRAWRRLDARDAVLVVAGQSLDPMYTRNLKRLTEGSPRIRLVDRFIADCEVPAFLSAADFVVLPFDRVQTSGSVVLAMSYGRPIVAPRLGELPEMLMGADDLLFTAGDEDSLLGQLRRAESLDLSDLARRTTVACDRLDWHHIGAATADVYRQSLRSC
jgi:beta-1,4-mannosyltransferase